MMRMLVLFIAICSAEVLNIPFYFSVPKESADLALQCDKIPYPSFWQPSRDEEEVGLKIIAVGQEPGTKNRVRARRNMADALSKSGTLQTGDVVLTFRPQMSDSMAYPHIQMGVTHAGLVYHKTKNGERTAFNIDSPLDYQYLGQFDSLHYAGDAVKDMGTDALHIVRPKNLDEKKRKQMEWWIATLEDGLSSINAQRAQMKFQSDYLLPRWAALQQSTRQTVTTFGKIILEVDKSTKLPMYCSEFAWHMLSLSSCTPEEIKRAGPEGASCVQEIFAPMPLTGNSATQVGLADGPLINLLKLSTPKERGEKVAHVFCTGGYACENGAKLSSGHRTVAKLVEPLMAGLSQVFSARAQGATAEMTSKGANELSAPVPVNYSPTGFLVQTMGGENACQYVATILFVDHPTLNEAKRDAKAQNPECDGKIQEQAASPRVAVSHANECIKKGRFVKDFQLHLINEHGAGIQADGYWGKRSLAAMNKVQRKFNMKITKCLTAEADELLRAVRN